MVYNLVARSRDVSSSADKGRGTYRNSRGNYIERRIAPYIEWAPDGAPAIHAASRQFTAFAKRPFPSASFARRTRSKRAAYHV